MTSTSTFTQLLSSGFDILHFYWPFSSNVVAVKVLSLGAISVDIRAEIRIAPSNGVTDGVSNDCRLSLEEGCLKARLGVFAYVVHLCEAEQSSGTV